jgi:hypothetical protein
MTKKDYIKIAEILKQGNAHLNFVGKNWHSNDDKSYAINVFFNIIVEGFSKILAEDNSKFDKNKFKKAISTASHKHLS